MSTRFATIAAGLGLALGLGVSACSHTYVAIGYDAAKQSKGVMDTTVVDRPDTGSVGVGVGGRTGGVELRFQTHDLDPAPAGDRFIAASASFEGRIVPLREGPASFYLHAGPAMGAVFDKQMLDMTYGIGLRGGGGVEAVYHGMGVWIDVAREQLTFGGDVVNGRGDRDVVSVGIRIGGT